MEKQGKAEYDDEYRAAKDVCYRTLLTIAKSLAARAYRDDTAHHGDANTAREAALHTWDRCSEKVADLCRTHLYFHGLVQVHVTESFTFEHCNI